MAVYQNYTQAPQQSHSYYEPLSVGGWMVTFLLLSIPLINLIMLFVWAFGGSTNIDRQNFCRAALIWGIILVGVSICFGVFAALLGAGSMYIG